MTSSSKDYPKWVPDAVAEALQQGIVSEDHPFVFVWNKDELRQVVADLKAAFPPSTLHAFALKANPVKAVLETMRDLGCGGESASPGEFTHCIRIFPEERCVFDSPCKSRKDLIAALQTKAIINIDCWEELDRIVEIRKTLGEDKCHARVGFRLNPQTGAGKIATFSTATATSKFGIAMERRDDIIAAINKYPWLNALHVHTGSQGCALTQIVAGIRVMVDLALDERVPKGQIRTLDIGGGLPANFDSETYSPTFAHYAQLLREGVPEIFDESRFQIVTEFGRAVMAKAGIMISRIEYTKQTGGRHIIVQHAGSDVALRTVWAPTTFPLRVDAFRADGTPVVTQDGDACATDVAGPCCFAGDLLAKERDMPKLSQGDIVVIRDVGAYYHSSFSIYNMRQAPPLCWFDRKEGGGVEVKVFKAGQTVEDTINFMS
eukprot:PhM_4_TR6721/c0_g1_i1/m.68583/K01586/lysA; diaminopimelate decarboxylase